MMQELPSDSVQLELALKGAAPWDGRSPRSLTRGYLQFVEKSRTFAKPATVMPTFTDPAQLTMFLQGTQNGS